MQQLTGISHVWCSAMTFQELVSLLERTYLKHLRNLNHPHLLEAMATLSEVWMHLLSNLQLWFLAGFKKTPHKDLWPLSLRNSEGITPWRFAQHIVQWLSMLFAVVPSGSFSCSGYDSQRCTPRHHSHHPQASPLCPPTQSLCTHPVQWGYLVLSG